MRRVYAGRSAPAPWAPPGGVVTAEVDRVTGLAVDGTCPASGPTYTEYFVGSPPARETCYPAGAYRAAASPTRGNACDSACA